MRPVLLAVVSAILVAGCGGSSGPEDPEIVNIQDPRATGTYDPGAGAAAGEGPSAAQELLHLLLPGLVGSSPDPMPGVRLRDKTRTQGTSPDPLPGRTGCQGQGCGRNPGGN